MEVRHATHLFDFGVGEICRLDGHFRRKSWNRVGDSSVIAHHVLDVLVIKIGLQRPRVAAPIGECVAAACLSMCGCAFNTSWATFPVRSMFGRSRQS